VVTLIQTPNTINNIVVNLIGMTFGSAENSQAIIVSVHGPDASGPDSHLGDQALEWGNALARVGDPKGAGGRFRDAPRSDQIGVGVIRELGNIRDQVAY